MVGEYIIEVSNKYLKYRLNVSRKYTILTGDSGTGKTVFADMVKEYNDGGESSGVFLSCDCDVQRLSCIGWEYVISTTKGRIYVIDSKDYCIRQKNFCESLKNSDNYFIIITRENLNALPCDITGVCTLTSSRIRTANREYTLTTNIVNPTMQDS